MGEGTAHGVEEHQVAGLQFGLVDGFAGLADLARTAGQVEAESFLEDMADEARNVWDAMQGVFADGFSTPDLSKPGSGVTMIGTDAFGDRVVEKLRSMPRV